MSDVTVGYRFTQNFPASYRTAASNAVLTWNGVGEPLQFYRRTNNASSTGTPDNADFAAESRPCSSIAPQNNNFLYRNLANSYGGFMFTRFCPAISSSGTPKQFRWAQIVVDSTPVYPWSTTDTPTTSRADFQSSFNHEMGHFAGSTYGPASAGGDQRGHFLDSDSTTCPESAARNVMCKTMRLGTIYNRELATHDVHTFQAAY
jgi:hypothetical protein